MVEQYASGSKHPLPPGDKEMGWAQYFWAEAKYHLLPWGPQFLTQKPAIMAAGIGLAMTVTAAWMLAATGRVEPLVMVFWWTSWSVYECISRMRCKPWIKEGPWWGKQYRRASIPDMIAYVATKNLLIGAILFWILYLLGEFPGFSN